jgi:formylmethanofuran dehydrogenase subunit E
MTEGTDTRQIYNEGVLMMDYQEIVRFHGHDCPGLAMGYRMAQAGMNALKALRSEDEEVVAIVENNACGVDALQCVTGCTFGKGNLIFRDYGKHVYTLYSRKTGKGVRVALYGTGIPKDMKENRAELIGFILQAREQDILSIREVIIDTPEPARIHNSVNCDICGERVMETRTRLLKGKTVCIPCAERAEIHRRIPNYSERNE